LPSSVDVAETMKIEANETAELAGVAVDVFPLGKLREDLV
jgi:hypothetical protein